MIPDPNTELLYLKVMWAAIRLTCYVWATIIFIILLHFLPNYRWLLEPFIRISFLLIGFNTGRYCRFYFPRKDLRLFKKYSLQIVYYGRTQEVNVNYIPDDELDELWTPTL